jgi:hypothetical protein
VSEPILDYDRLRGRVREVSSDVRAHSGLRERIDESEVTVHEQFSARFSDPQTIEVKNGCRLHWSLCDPAKFVWRGSASRTLDIENPDKKANLPSRLRRGAHLFSILR